MESKYKLWDFVKWKCSGTLCEQQEKQRFLIFFHFLRFIWTVQIQFHYLWTCKTLTGLYMYFKAIVGDKLQYLWRFSASPTLQRPAMWCVPAWGVHCWAVFAHIKSSQSLNHSLKVPVGLESSWKICLFCLLDLLFLMSEYCASRKKSLNCWSRAFFKACQE